MEIQRHSQKKQPGFFQWFTAFIALICSNTTGESQLKVHGFTFALGAQREAEDGSGPEPVEDGDIAFSDEEPRHGAKGAPRGVGEPWRG